MSEAVIDAAFFAGVGLLGYAHGGLNLAGASLVAAAMLLALFSVGGHDDDD